MNCRSLHWIFNLLKASLQGGGALKLKLDKMRRNLITRKVIGRAALAAEQLVKDHTEKGEDKDGKPFVGYSSGYMADKEKRSVNLHDKGHMLASIHGRAISKTRGEVGFSKSLEATKAAGHQFGSKRLPKRAFFGLQKTEQKQIAGLIEEHIKMVIHAR